MTPEPVSISPIRRLSATLPRASLALGLGLCAGLGAVAPAAAFDGDRRGFLVGLGGGLHASGGDESGDGFDDYDDSVAGLSLRLMVGGGLSERVTVYATRDVNIDADDAAFGLTGVGAHYYLAGNGPGAFLFAALGLGDLSFERTDDRDRYDDYDYDYDAAFGVGALFGAGYAITQGFHADASVMVVDVTDEDNFASDVDYTYVSVRAMLGYSWF